LGWLEMLSKANTNAESELLSVVVMKLFASVAAAIRLINHARKMDRFAGRGGLGVGA